MTDTAPARRYLACITTTGNSARGTRVHILRPDGKRAECDPWLKPHHDSQRGMYRTADSLDAVPERAGGGKPDLCGRCERALQPRPAPRNRQDREAAERARLERYVQGR